MQLADISKSIPTEPGIYFFKDGAQKILYIGKAKNLRNRVRSYFNKSNKDAKSSVMLSKARAIDFLIVSNEVEAIITEANMIKEYKPKYNICLKDDKTFPYIAVTDEEYPRVEIVRKKNLSKDGNIYFGPYSDVGYLRQVIKALHRIFPIKTCKTIKSKKETCFCGFCIYKRPITRKYYQNIIELVIGLLKGKRKVIEQQIKNLMKEASDNFNFEQAAIHRDQLSAITFFSKRQKKIEHDFKSYDIVHAESKNKKGLGMVIRVRNGLLVGKESFEFKATEQKTDFKEILRSFLIQYYDKTLDIPKEVVVNADLKEKGSIKGWLSIKSGSKVSITFPRIGNKRKMLDLCIKNCMMALKDMILKKSNRKDYLPKTLEELKKVLLMKSVPLRIEAFDNSNLAGNSPVSAMVCFINGKAVKKEYRKFNIKTVSGIDDFKSMEEVVYRCYSRRLREKKELPDLIVIDGGKGQLSSAKRSLDKLGLSKIAIVGLAKRLEEVFVPESSDPQNISKTSSSLYLLRKIRDEVHRYAITFHKQKRAESAFDSNLKRIRGLGEKRFQALFNEYKNIKTISSKTAEEILGRTSIPIRVCEEIVRTLKGD